MSTDEKAAAGDNSDGQMGNGATQFYTGTEPRIKRRLAEIAFNNRVNAMVRDVTRLMFNLAPEVCGGSDEDAPAPVTAERLLRGNAWFGCCKCARVWQAATTNGLCPFCGTADVELLGSPEGKR